MKELREKTNREKFNRGDNFGGQGGGDEPLISLVIPAYNEEANIPRLEKELMEVTSGLPYRFEFILIDNHSTDRTGQMIKTICKRDNRWKYILMSKNFHVESSIAAGYHYASGDAMIVLYSDLQEPPSVIPQFLESWRQGYDIVHGVHTKRVGESLLLSFLVKCAYQFVSWCSESPIPADAGDFRLISRRVRDVLEQCGDYHRYTRGLIAWLGFPQTTVKYARQPRRAGKGNSDFAVYWRYFSNAITSFSMKPLRLFLILGIASMVIAGLLLVSCAFASGDRELMMFCALAMLQFLLGGLAFLGIGFLGEYCGRTYTEVKNRPLFIVQELINFDGSPSKRAEAELTLTHQ